MKQHNTLRAWVGFLSWVLLLSLSTTVWGQRSAGNQPPSVKLNAPITTVRLPASCANGMRPNPNCASANEQIKLTTEASDPENDSMTFNYTATGGRIEGSGPSAVWDLSGLRPGVYRANVYVKDGANSEVCDWITVNVAECDCVAAPPPPARRPCADIAVQSSADTVQAGENVTLTANVRGADTSVSYNWVVSAGNIVRGQGSPSIVVDTAGLDGRNVTATVEIGNLPADCPSSKSVSFGTRAAPAMPKAVKIDSFGTEPNDAVKARLDSFGSALQQDPSAQGYIIAYGGCAGEGVKRAQFMKDYLVRNRGLDAGRLTIVDGGCRDSATYELYSVPQGATAPGAENSNPCAPCKRGKGR